MKSTTEIIGKYTTGEKSLEETNAALREAGAGSLDKVEVRDGQLANCDMGESYALVFIADRMSRVPAG